MSEIAKLRLGLNIDHVATIRNARGGRVPDPLRAVKIAVAAGVDNITAHLREDRRHISDDDIARLASEINEPLNLEMAATEEMLQIALRHKPHACCLVPEKRQELTTEGGLDVVALHNRLPDFILPLQRNGSRLSLFIDPEPEQVRAAAALQADCIEIHAGPFTHAHHNGDSKARAYELSRIHEAAQLAAELGLEVHAGHGFCYETVGDVAAIKDIVELNIGHFLISEAIFQGLETALLTMRAAMDEGRKRAA